MDRRNTIIAGAAFAAYAAASLLWSSDPLWGLAQFAFLAAGIPLAFLPQRYLWLGFILAIEASLFISWASADYIPYGLYGNPNYFACAIALALAGALAYEWALWFNIPALGAGLIYCQSRGAAIAGAVAILLWSWRRSRLAAVVVAIACVAFVIAIGQGRDSAIAQRLGIWHDTMANFTLFGHGLGSFANDYWNFPIHTNATLIRAFHSYNDILELIFLFGVGTVPLWFFLAGILPATSSEARLVLGTFAVLGLSFFPFHIFPLNTLLVATLTRTLLPVAEPVRRRTLYA